MLLEYNKILEAVSVLDSRIINTKRQCNWISSQIIRKVNAIGLPSKIINKYVYDKKQDNFFINAEYAPDLDQVNKPCIIIKWNFKRKTVFFRKDTWLFAKHIIVDVICHEFKHLEQYRKRGFKEGTVLVEDEEYYSDTDEIEAHAMNIAFDLFRRYGKAAHLYYEEKNINPYLTIYQEKFKKYPNVLLELHRQFKYYLKELETESKTMEVVM